MTDEFPDRRLHTFIGLGSKTYSIVWDGGAIVKVKGVKLNSATLDLLDTEFLIRAAMDYKIGKTTQVAVPQFELRTDSSHNIYSRFFHKIVRATGDKRLIRSDLTLPFGFIIV